MGRLFQPLLFFLLRCSRRELIRQIEFLKLENELLRNRVPRKNIVLRRGERLKLLKLGMAIGPGVEKLITIVQGQTFRRWVRDFKKQAPAKRMGRPRTPEPIRELVLRIARETGWGYTRILGEIRKLGYTGISRQTVVNILKREGLDPRPKRGPGTWDEFVKVHAETLWQWDFISTRVITRLGLRQVFALVFLNVATRRVWVSPCTQKPTAAWIEEQAKTFVTSAAENNVKVGLVTRDRDCVYNHTFDPVFETRGIVIHKLRFRSPNLNAYVERFIQAIQVERLDHFLVFGEKHFDYLVREYVEHYHEERPHQGLGNCLLCGEPPPAVAGKIGCRERLGGLLKHYYQAA